MRHIAANALTVLIVLGLVVAGVVAWGVQRFESPGPHGAETLVEVPRGATLTTVAERLAEAGVITDPLIFRIGVRYRGDAAALKFGEYAVPAGASMAEIAGLLTTGRTVQYFVTIPEGLTSWEIVERLKGEEILTGEIAEIPAEGSLAPDTYSVGRGDPRTELIARMQARQTRILADAWAARDPDLPLASPEEVLILASIVEKETGVAGERDLVAGVFVNRLRLGMRLQTDPTVIYGVTEGRGALGRGLRRSELDRPTPWNTYQIDGLPPTPIANPGRAAIDATVAPARTDALYFVADGTGGHAFAETYREHLRNVQVWRRIEAERAAD